MAGTPVPRPDDFTEGRPVVFRNAIVTRAAAAAAAASPSPCSAMTSRHPRRLPPPSIRCRRRARYDPRASRIVAHGSRLFGSPRRCTRARSRRRSRAARRPRPGTRSRRSSRRTRSFEGPFGHFERAAATRLSSLSACLRRLPRHGSPVLSQSRRAGRAGILRRRRSPRFASQVQVSDGPTARARCSSAPDAPRIVSVEPFCKRARGARGQPRRVSTRLVGDGEGAPARAQFYIYALLTGYHEPPAGLRDVARHVFNVAFPGHQIAMPPPLSDGAVDYTDGTKPTVDNYARDVSAFLMWSAEPKLEERLRLGARVMLFLIVFAVIMYLAKRMVWSRVGGDHAPAP